MIKKSGGVIHGFAECETCGWKSESYKNILGISAMHAKRHKHLVLVEVAYSFDYDGRE